MRKKQLWKVMGTGALALSMFLLPAVSASADEVIPASGSALGLDPTRTVTVAAVGTEGTEGYQAEKPAYADTEIPVYGFTVNTTVYSADIEWGAMTFQYENSSWDPVTHKKKDGAGWKVYDDKNGKALDAEEDEINEIKVTNHSNAPVYATLEYASETGYEDTTGKFSFTAGTETGDTKKLTDAAGGVPAYLTLDTANNNNGEGEGVGKETIAKAYFMPDGIKETDGSADTIGKWTKIGTITVSLKTEEPTAAP